MERAVDFPAQDVVRFLRVAGKNIDDRSGVVAVEVPVVAVRQDPKGEEVLLSFDLLRAWCAKESLLGQQVENRGVLALRKRVHCFHELASLVGLDDGLSGHVVPFDAGCYGFPDNKSSIIFHIVRGHHGTLRSGHAPEAPEGVGGASSTTNGKAAGIPAAFSFRPPTIKRRRLNDGGMGVRHGARRTTVRRGCRAGAGRWREGLGPDRLESGAPVPSSAPCPRSRP